MPTEKIADFDPCKDNGTWRPLRKVCRHPEHDPPTMMVFSPGVWKHTCPACGRSTTFTVYPTHLSTKDNAVVQPKIRPMDVTVHRPTGTWTGRSTRDDVNPMHAFGHGRGD